MQIAMKADVVSSACNLPHDLWVMLQQLHRNEKVAFTWWLSKDVEDARHTLFGAVGRGKGLSYGQYCRHRAWSTSFLRPGQCHHHGNPFVVRPVHHALFPPFCFCT